MIRIVALGALVVAAAWSVLLARAAAADTDRAMALIPTNTAYLALATLQVELDGGDPAPLLQRIVQLTPRVSAPRIRLGLATEQSGDVVQAERWLLEAYSVDRQFETRWTLANFYFRHGRTDEFWTWIRSALEVSYGDRRPMFDLCWRMTSDAQQILHRAIPEREEVAADYLNFLMSRPEVLADAALKVRRVELLLAATDVLLNAKRYADAVTVWKHAGRSAPEGVTASNFEAPQTGRGFDWRLHNEIGVRHRSPGRIQLTGEQPESVQLLNQYVGGLKPGQRYLIEWHSSPVVPGVHWRVDELPGSEFRATSEVALLSLWYQRPLGEVRAEASFELSDVKLTLH